MPRHPARFYERMVRCVAGLGLFGVGIACIIDADLGLAPWDVFHQGVSELTGVPIGRVIVVTGVFLLLAWVPLRQRPGLGTVLNALEIGIVVDLVEPLVDAPAAWWAQLGLLALGLVLIGVGSGMYIGAGLGAGPRDGLMMGLAARGISVRLARTVVELTVLAAGIALGGSVGIGTLAFALGVGPLVQLSLPRLDVRGDLAEAVSSGSAPA